uniref:Uncharacterized protein n=1 Tax=Onchocerca volvulus TaxID=6282 RepID=A0A8R1U0F0_ONCVO
MSRKNCPCVSSMGSKKINISLERCGLLITTKQSSRQQSSHQNPLQPTNQPTNQTNFSIPNKMRIRLNENLSFSPEIPANDRSVMQIL